MEHPSDPRTLPSPSTLPGPAVSSAPGRGMVFRRTLRLLLRRLLYGIVSVLRPLRNYIVPSAIIVALLGVVGWLGFQLWSPRPGVVADTRVELIPPAAAVENYIKGQQNYNAELMWDAMSPELQANQMGNGSSKATLQSLIDRKRQSGLQFSRYQYVGGESSDGGTMYTYFVDVQQDTNHATFPMTFVVDKNGKVANILSHQLLNDMASSSQ